VPWQPGTAPGVTCWTVTTPWSAGSWTTSAAGRWIPPATASWPPSTAQARAIRCARQVAEKIPGLGLELRSGLHTGEIELAGEHIRGLAVHIGARVVSLAGPGEVLVSSTVKDLVAGSGIVFEDRGEHTLKGVPGTWRIYIATSA